jgi:hypothetical protein
LKVYHQENNNYFDLIFMKNYEVGSMQNFVEYLCDLKLKNSLSLED